MKSWWMMGVVGASCALGMSMGHAQASSLQEAKDALDQAPWEDKAMFIERWDVGKWRPMAQIPLKSGWISPPSASSMRFVVWHQGAARRLEIICGAGAQESYVAWDGLRISRSSAMEFGCLGAKYRAQMGRMDPGGSEHPVAEDQAQARSKGEQTVAPENKE